MNMTSPPYDAQSAGYARVGLQEWQARRLYRQGAVCALAIWRWRNTIFARFSRQLLLSRGFSGGRVFLAPAHRVFLITGTIPGDKGILPREGKLSSGTPGNSVKYFYLKSAILVSFYLRGFRPGGLRWRRYSSSNSLVVTQIVSLNNQALSRPETAIWRKCSGE